MPNLREYKLLGTYLEDAVIYHAVEKCQVTEILRASGGSALEDPTMEDAMKWIEDHEKEYHG